MDKRDFTKGQQAYLKYIGDRRNGTIRSIKEVIVKSVGSKYITTVDGDRDYERKFDISNDFREFYTIGGSNYQLFLSEQHILDENEKERLEDEIRRVFSGYGKTKLLLEQLRQIKSIIG